MHYYETPKITLLIKKAWLKGLQDHLVQAYLI